MKRVIEMKRVLILMACAPLGILGLVRDAGASIYVHANICQPYYGAPSTDLVHTVDGVRNRNKASQYMLCPLPREANAYAAFAIVGRNSPGATTSCAVYGIDRFGKVLVAKSFFSSRDIYSELITFPTELPMGGFTTLFCYLPGSSQGVLTGVTVY